MPFDRSAALVQRNLPGDSMRCGELFPELDET